ncbi:TPA: hypothetical protein N0F65_012946 [Lagenidium giganteum]|uniref:Uncharacterized protein n=1 Tax=Lagenidium giganteum TaxID=4803 RepID=A0AAV2Z452_9STRA|nr:TPA: hypothetical protein N0F65_012946 [Lagenidium giganteum]
MAYPNRLVDLEHLLGYSNQKYCYNGHKRKHGLKFQSLVAPNGLIAHLHAPPPPCRQVIMMRTYSPTASSCKTWWTPLIEATSSYMAIRLMADSSIRSRLSKARD